MKILNRFTQKIIFKDTNENFKKTIENGIKNNVNLSEANLSGVNLSEANLSEANLSGVNLSLTNLSGANLSGANLFGVNLSGATLSGANLSEAYLSRADLSWANLSEADLSGADLSGADLYRAYLYRANLSWTNLSWANLSWANLSGANLYKRKNIEYETLRHQKTLILYKYLQKNMIAPYYDFRYEINKKYISKNVDVDKRKTCGSGINVATLEWCLKNINYYIEDYIIVECECKGKDLIIPYTTDGKFRLKEGAKMKILKKVSKKTLKKYMEETQ